MRIGRAETCEIILHDDAEISRVHAEVWLDEQGRVVVQDRGSKNGTRADDGQVFRNEKRVAYRSFRIGGHDFKILGAAPDPRDKRQIFSPGADQSTMTGDTQYFPSSRKLDLNAQRLQLLIQLGERIGGVFDRKQLLEQALNACCDALGFERGMIALKTQRGDTESPVTRNVQVDENGAYKISRTLINRALQSGERAIVNNPATDIDTMTESMVRFPICSALCVPILNRNEVLGVIYGDRVTQAATYQPADVDFLAAIAQQVGVGIANLRLLQEHVRAQKVYAELDAAREIQRRLLPDEPMAVNRIALEGYNDPSFAVSGDYYDYFPLDRGRIGFIIADVTGHGLSAALIMANVQSAIRVALTPNVELTDLISRVNRLICRNTQSHVFITAILGTIDSASGAVDFVSAGHPGPILLSAKGARVLETDNSLPLGVEPEERFHVVHVDPAERLRALLFYTDGLTEAMDAKERLLGIEPVIDGLSRAADATTAGLIRTARGVLRDHLDGAQRMDDMTLLAAQIKG